jgi:hypothetical protein
MTEITTIVSVKKMIVMKMVKKTAMKMTRKKMRAELMILELLLLKLNTSIFKEGSWSSQISSYEERHLLIGNSTFVLEMSLSLTQPKT